eukprot:TRINITY_DN8858_c0_g2_i1.p1 TRINITY_DN8858_c0_g2~~TRINITY_DN8858_c0_g2_i1.p1  ORF type:complete len:619 (-),score=169.17 TRINITY_DN8858_c0_g2_i1:605-2407(-)
MEGVSLEGMERKFGDVVWKVAGNEVRGVYPYGSRVYGTATTLSDHDFKVILKEYDGDSNEVLRDNISVCFYEESVFLKLIENNDIMALICILSPEHLILKSNPNHLKHFNLDLRKLKNSVGKEANQTWAKAKLLWESDVSRAKKNLCHSFRYLYFGIQIVQTGKITNFGAANDIYNDLFSNDGVKCFGDAQDLLKAKFLKLFEDFKRLVDSEIGLTNTVDVKAGNIDSTFKDITNFIHNNGIKQLVRLYSFQSYRHPTLEHLYYVKYDPSISPPHNIIVKQGNGLVIDTSKTQPGVVVFPSSIRLYDKTDGIFWKHNNFDKTNFEAFELLEGENVVMFYYKMQWVIHGTCYHNEFWDVWKSADFGMPESTELVYYFNFAIAKNCVIIQRENIVLYNVQSVSSLKNLDYPEICALSSKFNWKVTKKHTFKSLDEAVEQSKALNFLHYKGFVCMDPKKMILKITSPQYASLHTILKSTSLSTTVSSLLYIIHFYANGTNLLTQFPQLEEMYSQVQALYDKYSLTVSQHYELITQAEDVMEEASKYTFGNVVVMMSKKGFVNPKKYFESSWMEERFLFNAISKSFPGFPNTLTGEIKIYNKTD